MTDLPAHKDHDSWYVKTILRHGFIKSCNFSRQLRTDSFVGVQVQLPIVAQGQIVDCPIALSTIVGKNMLGDLNTVLPSDFQRTVLTIGIDDVDVAVVTGYGTIETAVQTMQYGAADYVQKPFTEEELVEFTRKLVIKRDARLAAQRRPTVRVVTPENAETAAAHEFCVPGGAFVSEGHAWARIEPSGQVTVDMGAPRFEPRDVPGERAEPLRAVAIHHQPFMHPGRQLFVSVARRCNKSSVFGVRIVAVRGHSHTPHPFLVHRRRVRLERFFRNVKGRRCEGESKPRFAIPCKT